MRPEFYKKFTVGYNPLISPEAFINTINQYKDSVESVFFGLHSCSPNHQRGRIVIQLSSWQEITQEDENVKKVIPFLKEMGIKTTFLLNCTFAEMTRREIEYEIVSKIKPTIEEFKIDSVVVADFMMAKCLREFMPFLDIQGSCNQFLWNPIMYDKWYDEIGIEIFNAPREILRMPELLKELGSKYKLKCIVNEGCMFGCPCNLRHSLCISSQIDSSPDYCEQYCRSPENIFKQNWITPKYLEKVLPYVYLFKIATRNSSLGEFQRTLDAYINENNNYNLLDVTYSKNHEIYKSRGIFIDMNKLPEKLFTCQCKECKTCKVCPSLAKKFGMI